MGDAARLARKRKIVAVSCYARELARTLPYNERQLANHADKRAEEEWGALPAGDKAKYMKLVDKKLQDDDITRLLGRSCLWQLRLEMEADGLLWRVMFSEAS